MLIPGVRSSSSVTPISCARSIAALSSTATDDGISPSVSGARVAVTMMLSASAATACAVSAAAAVEEAATAARQIELRKIALNIGQTHRQCRPSARPIGRPLGTHDIARAPAQPALSSCGFTPVRPARSEEHTSELQSLMRISYAVFCLKKKTIQNRQKMLTTQTKHKKTNRHQ